MTPLPPRRLELSVAPPSRHRRDRLFDGIICFGGVDWWYHNRGHYDIQMMRRFAGVAPVLYVNSIGMRMPRPGASTMFVQRMSRKVRSMMRGLAHPAPNFSVLSPFSIPGSGVGMTRSLLAWQVRRAAHQAGIQRPLVWVACPPAAEVVPDLDPVALIYQRTDRYEAFEDVNVARIHNYDQWLKAHANMTLFCAAQLMAEEAEDCRRPILVDHGVDYERFANGSDMGEPAELARIPHPRVGYVGGIDRHTFDVDLLSSTAARMPQVQFVIVGPSTQPGSWTDRPNIHVIPQRPYEQVPAYLAACDALIMPWQRNRWIEACHPVKLKEYLAAGRPVVTTPFSELQRYAGLLRIAEDAATFESELRSALTTAHDPTMGQARVRADSWESRVDMVVRALAEVRIRPRGAPAEPPLAAPDILIGGEQAAGTGSVQVEAKPSSVTGPAQPIHDVMSVEGAPPLDLAACILLAGGLRPSPLVAAAGYSVLDLWISPSMTVLESWINRVTDLAGLSNGAFPIRIITDLNVPSPGSLPADDRLRIEREPQAFRGPAGVLRDSTQSCDPSRHILVGEAARFVTTDLQRLVDIHRARDADVTVAANRGGDPSGVYLIRIDSLRLVPPLGYTDIKEQWLRQAVDAGLRVHVHPLQASGAMPLRTRRQFMEAVRIANAQSDYPLPPARGVLRSQDAENARVICPGSIVGPGASVIDSVVMPGAVVGASSVVVRSIVSPGAIIEPGSEIVDQIVSGATVAQATIGRAA